MMNCTYLGFTPNGPVVVPLFWRTPHVEIHILLYFYWLYIYIYIHIGTVRTATSFRSGSVPLPVIWCRLENIIWRYGRRGVKTPSGRSSLERCTENPNVSKRPESDVWIFDTAKQAHRCWGISVGSWAVQQWHCKPINAVRWSFSVSNCFSENSKSSVGKNVYVPLKHVASTNAMLRPRRRSCLSGQCKGRDMRCKNKQNTQICLRTWLLQDLQAWFPSQSQGKTGQVAYNPWKDTWIGIMVEKTVVSSVVDPCFTRVLVKISNLDGRFFAMSKAVNRRHWRSWLTSWTPRSWKWKRLTSHVCFKKKLQDGWKIVLQIGQKSVEDCVRIEKIWLFSKCEAAMMGIAAESGQMSEVRVWGLCAWWGTLGICWRFEGESHESGPGRDRCLPKSGWTCLYLRDGLATWRDLEEDNFTQTQTTVMHDHLIT